MSNTRTKKAPKTASEKLAAAERVQDAMTIYLPGPLRAEWNRVKEDYDRARAASTQAGAQMLNGDPEVKKLAARLAELEEQMQDNAIDVTVQALRRRRTPATPKDELTWNELCEQHPPRKGKDNKPLPEDSLGVNIETFPEALIRASTTGPDLAADEWDSLLYEYMTEQQYDGLFAVCWRLNKSAVDVPFSFAASKTRTSGTSSRRPSGSASPANASKAGNQPK
jgi:hypothetical protein